MEKLFTITEVSKLIENINTKTNKPLNHILRFWEKEFKQIKPTIIRNRRYYSKDQINLIKLIKFLLKDKGMTINGVKNILKSKINSLDDYNSYSLKADYHRKIIKEKQYKNQIIDNKRINIILKKIKKESIRKKIDPKITKNIWKAMIRSFINYEFRNFKKK